MRQLALKAARLVLGITLAFSAGILPSVAEEPTPAKVLFGGMKLPSVGKAQPVGFYAKGCMNGGIAIPTEGPTWQAIHLSRNRRWGQPQMISLLERLSKEAAAKDGWPGLLIGDISQPRGGPMLTGHASHQIGLDADIWLTPMPKRTLSYEERENIPEYSMLREGTLRVDPNRWTPAHAALIMRAASYPEVERIFVHPGIKKKLCDTWKGDRSFMGKVRPYYGHHYHFHIRLKCPANASGCESQAPVDYGDGCGKELAWWLSDKPWGKPGPKTDKKPVKPVKPRFMKLSDLPKACAVVLKAPSVASEMVATLKTDGIATAYAAAETSNAVRSVEGVIADTEWLLPDVGPVPANRPAGP